jgi:hypothetical protein
MMFLVISDHPDGPYVPEVDLDRMTLTNVTKDLVDGQYSRPIHVIEFNPVEHLCRECTHEFRELLERDPDDA